MGTDYFQSKSLTRDYHSYFQDRLHLLDVMVARRSWRKYKEWSIDAEMLSQLEAFLKRSAALRGCPDKDIILVTDKNRLPELFKSAYKGVIGKINPWLRKSGAAGLLAIVIKAEDRQRERPITYGFPTMTGQDAMLWLTEKGLGSIWLAGINGKEMAAALGLTSDKWVPAIIVFGKTFKKPGGLNIDNFVYKSISRRRKALPEILYNNYYGEAFDIPESLSLDLYSDSSVQVSDCLESISKWDRASTVEISRFVWELLGESARIAPSSANRQPWKFVLIHDKNLVAELAGLLKETRPLSGIIAGLGTEGSMLESGMERPFWMIDLPIAFSHITIMAGALNLSSRVCLDIPESRINTLLKVDQNWRTVGLVGLR